jgi:hypothetical protein
LRGLLSALSADSEAFINAILSRAGRIVDSRRCIKRTTSRQGGTSAKKIAANTATIFCANGALLTIIEVNGSLYGVEVR